MDKIKANIKSIRIQKRIAEVDIQEAVHEIVERFKSECGLSPWQVCVNLAEVTQIGPETEFIVYGAEMKIEI